MTLAGAAKDLSCAGGWQASLGLEFRAGEKRTELAARHRKGPLAVQRPFYPEGDVCHVYLLHPPGGVVGGDRLAIEAHAATGSRVLVTAPGATKFYRSAGETAYQSQTLWVESGAAMEWLPQENIFFPGALVELRTRVELKGDGRLALWEIQCLGRPAVEEVFDRGHVDSRMEIYRDGQPLVLERLRIDPASRLQLSSMAGMAVCGTFLVSHAGDEELENCRESMAAEATDHAGATLLDDLLVVRYLGHSTEQARRLFTRVWRQTRETTIGRIPCPPRIWAT